VVSKENAASEPQKPPLGYVVLARRYRPSQFAQVIGQEHVTRTLQNAIEAGRVHHAYLFTGSRGVGKTTVARILAKALNCDRGATPIPVINAPRALKSRAVARWMFSRSMAPAIPASMMCESCAKMCAINPRAAAIKFSLSMKYTCSRRAPLTPCLKPWKSRPSCSFYVRHDGAA